MAKFSVERDEEESEGGVQGSSSSPKHKKQRRIRDEEEGSKVDNHRDVIGQDRDCSGSSNRNSISVTLIDPEVLDCSICLEPLAPPVFQCENGHIACFSCCTKINNKCPSCSWPIGYNRCLAIEKVIESIKVSCCNVHYGCRESFTYTHKQTHEDTCIYAPCMCPIAECTFRGSSLQLSLHFSSKHWSFAQRFRYNCPFSVCFDKNESYHVLQGEEDGLLFLLNNQIELIGNAITLNCIGPSSSKRGFSYDLISRRGTSSLRLQSFTNYVKGRMEASSSSSSSLDFLLLPHNFYNCSSQINLEVCIWSSRELE